MLIRLLLVALVLGSCATRQPERRAEDLQEAALRWAFANAETDLDAPAIYCIAHTPVSFDNGVDPEPLFLERFSGHAIPVRPVSACRFPVHDRHNVIERATGAFGLLFTFSTVRWEGPARGIVRVGFQQGGLWGSGWECVVERNSTEWVVTRCDRVLDV